MGVLHGMQLPSRKCWVHRTRNEQNLRETAPAVLQGGTTQQKSPRGSTTRKKKTSKEIPRAKKGQRNEFNQDVEVRAWSCTEQQYEQIMALQVLIFTVTVS